MGKRVPGIVARQPRPDRRDGKNTKPSINDKTPRIGDVARNTCWRSHWPTFRRWNSAGTVRYLPQSSDGSMCEKALASVRCTGGEAISVQCRPAPKDFSPLRRQCDSPTGGFLPRPKSSPAV